MASRHPMRLLSAFTCVLVAASVLVSCSESSKENPTQPGEGQRLFLRRSPAEDVVFDEASGAGFVDNELIATARRGVSYEMVASFAKDGGVEIAGHDPYLLKYQLLLPAAHTREELEAICAGYADCQLFESVRLNLAFRIHGDGILSSEFDPDDPEWAGKWPAGDRSPNWGIDAIRAREMWDIGGLGEKSARQVNAGILDSQFFTGHEDLIFADTFNNAFRPEAGSHGTHVAGTVAATFGNGRGIAGIAPTARLFAASGVSGLERSEEEGQVWTVFAMTSAMSWLIAANECRVVLFACGWSLSGDGALVRDEAARALHDYLLLGCDFVVVAGAGNGTAGDGVPAAAETVSPLASIGGWRLENRIIVVAAAQQATGTKTGVSLAGYSNSGERCDIAAPGSDVQSTVYRDSRRDGYGLMSGSSVAAAHVTGVVACLVSLQPLLDGSRLKEIVCDASRAVVLKDPLNRRRSGPGMLDAREAARTASETVSPSRLVGNWAYRSDLIEGKTMNGAIFQFHTDGTLAYFPGFYSAKRLESLDKRNVYNETTRRPSWYGDNLATFGVWGTWRLSRGSLLLDFTGLYRWEDGIRAASGSGGEDGHFEVSVPVIAFCGDREIGNALVLDFSGMAPVDQWVALHYADGTVESLFDTSGEHSFMRLGGEMPRSQWTYGAGDLGNHEIVDMADYYYDWSVAGDGQHDLYAASEKGWLYCAYGENVGYTGILPKGTRVRRVSVDGDNMMCYVETVQTFSYKTKDGKVSFESYVYGLADDYGFKPVK